MVRRLLTSRACRGLRFADGRRSLLYTPMGMLVFWRVAHTVKDKTKLLNRVRRLQGQLAAVEKALVEERECEEILHTLAACRGAIGALTAEVMEGHVRGHIADPDATSERSRAARQLIDVIKRYLR
jgi:DNA-binding FrmR family transcriptional regulator